MTINQFFIDCWLWLSEFATWELAKNVANSAFATSLIGSLTGAFGGAVAAQRIAERSKHREEILREIRNTNAAIAVAFGIANTALSFKEQYVKSMKEEFDNNRDELIRFCERNTVDTTFYFQANLQTLYPPLLPTEILRTLVFDRLCIVDRPLHLVNQIVQAAQGLVKHCKCGTALSSVSNHTPRMTRLSRTYTSASQTD